jgi:hypothetical protein
VATSFLFQLHPVSQVNAGPTLWELDQAAAVLRWYREFIPSAPETLNGFFAFLSVPPGPPFPAHLHDKRMCAVVWCHTGPQEEAARLLAAVHEPAEPALHGVQPMPYPMLQSAFDGLYEPGLQWYWRGDFVTELSDAAIERHLDFAKVPTPLSTMHLYPVDGAVQRVARMTRRTATARRGGPRPSSASIPIPPTRRGSPSGPGTTGRPCTPIPPVDAM